MSSDGSPSSTVSWQTLFWTLIPLVTNVMTQPSGRVLSLPSRYRTYLRSSPIICFLDALAFLLRIFITPCLLPVSVHQALETTIRERYKEIEDASEGIQSLEKQTWLRWVFFVVGTLGPSIKLMSMQGVPWTKAWGCMFLFGFLATEAAAMFHRRPSTTAVYSSLPGIHNSSAQGSVELRVSRRFESAERWLFRAGLGAHCVVALWAFFDLWALRAPAYAREAKVISVSKADLLSTFLWGNLVICGLTIMELLALSPVFGFLEGLYNGTWRYEEWRYEAEQIIGILLFSIVGCISLLYLEHFIFMTCGFFIFRDCVLFSITICTTPAFVWAMKKLCYLSPRLAETLLVSFGRESSPAVDTGAVYALALCIASIVLCMLWYWLKYNPVGTVNPSWTGIFG